MGFFRLLGGFIGGFLGFCGSFLSMPVKSISRKITVFNSPVASASRSTGRRARTAQP
jgi:hypothetical protein